VQAHPDTLLVFDVDGTLMRSGDAVRAQFQRAFEEVAGRAPERPEDIRFAGMTDRFIVRTLLETSGIEHEFESFFARFADRFCTLLEQHYPEHPAPRLLPGVSELLRELGGREGLALVLGTGNIRRSSEIKLERFGVLGLFQAGGDGGSVAGGFGGEHEERPDVIRQALSEGRDRLGWSGQTAWVIGDTPNDISAARAAGTKVLAVATGMVSREELAEHEPDALLDDFSDTGAVLTALRLGEAG
jgi:phosphoglycolate phosphatase-like HAD superfamily hydrolase